MPTARTVASVASQQALVDLLVVLTERRADVPDRPGFRTAVGKTFCMGNSPSSGCVSRMIASRAAKCGSANMSLARKMRPAGTPPSCNGQQLVRILGGRPRRDEVSSSSMCWPRARGSRTARRSASSGWPMTAVSRRNTVSWFAAIRTISPSRGRVDIARRDVRQRRAGALALVSRDLPLRQQRLHQCQDGFVDRRVDDLASSCATTVVQGHQRPERGEGRGERVAQRDSRPGRRTVRVTGDVTDATHRLADRAIARSLGIGSGLPEASDPSDHQPWVDLHNCSGARPHRSRVPGRKFSTKQLRCLSLPSS